MDPSPVRTSPLLEAEDKDEEEDEWDNDGFVIPSLGIIEEPIHQNTSDDASVLQPPPQPLSPKAKTLETIYLGPHGAPPSQTKPQESPATPTRKQRFRQKLKEADRRIGGTGRENKLENLQELVGTGKVNASKVNTGTPRDWLDPHCHESQFEKQYRQ